MGKGIPSETGDLFPMKNIHWFLLLTATAALSSAAEKPAYPLTTCVVSDEKLGSMGKAYVHQHEGREVLFCCKSCIKSFNKDPKQYLKKIDDAAAKLK
jgi:YHS domain-containing protein